MSVYSGFGTRQQETFYNKLIEKSFSLLCERIMQFYRGEDAPVNEMKFVKHIRKIVKYMAVLDRSKFMAPRLSETLMPLSAFLKDNFVRIFVNLFHFV